MHTDPHNSLIFIALQIVIIVLRCPDVSLLLTMAFIATLPSELLLQIYQNLCTVDDVYALGHCSKSLYSIIISNGNLSRIMTSIIVRTSCPRIVATHTFRRSYLQVRSPTHSRDISLCCFLDSARKLETVPARDMSNNSQSAASLPASFYATEKNLTSEHIWAIICRWKVVKSLYLDGYTCMESICCWLCNMSLERNDIHCAACDSIDSAGLKSLPQSTLNFAEYYKRVIDTWLTMEAEGFMRML
jgi:hypothetical protein